MKWVIKLILYNFSVRSKEEKSSEAQISGKRTVPRVSRLLFMYEPSLRRIPVVSVLELSDPARSIKF
jgi:hypothetical protein